MVHFVGAGPGAVDLITVRGKALLEKADVVIYTGSLVNPKLLDDTQECCSYYDSAHMTLEEVISVICQAENAGLTTVRLHTGDPSIYGAVREQMDALSKLNIDYDVTPGVSSFCAAAAAIPTEYTLPGVSQTVIISREEGRTPVPEDEMLPLLAMHKASMVLFLSAGLGRQTQEDLLLGGYTPDTPAVIVYHASWPDERVIHCTVGTLADTLSYEQIQSTALLLIGDFLKGPYERSRLYDPNFETGYRRAQS